MKLANWTKVGVVIAILALVSMWIIHLLGGPQGKESVVAKKNTQSIGNITTGNNSPVTVNQQNIFKIENFDPEKTRQLEALLRRSQAYQHPFPDRPKIGIVEPSIVFVNFIDNPPHYTGLIKAGINIPLLNVGGVTAKNVITKWKIYDNGNYITSASDYFGYDPYLIDQLLPNTARNLYYNPDIGANGTGTFEVVLEVEYTNANTGEKYIEQFKGATDYRAEKDSKPVRRVLTLQ
jgi:hypothetical protein